MDVRSGARDHHAVDSGEELVQVKPIAEGRDQHRKYAGPGDRRLEILLWCRVPEIVVELAHIR